MDIYEEDVAVEESPIPQFGGHYDERAPQLNAYQPWDSRAPQLNQNPDVDWDYVNKTVAPYLRMQQYQEQKKLRDAKIREQAIRFAGQQEMDSLIKAGTTPMEAFRRTAGKIHYNDPEGYASSMMRLREPVKPSMENIDGIPFIKYGDGRYSPAPKPPTPSAPRLNQVEKAEMDHRIQTLKDNEILKADPTKQARLIAETLADYGQRLKTRQPTVDDREGYEVEEKVLEVPKLKSELSKGARYKTSKGILTWDGEKFVR